MKFYSAPRSLIRKDAGEWLFIDVGFSGKQKSCGIAFGDEEPRLSTFGNCVAELVKLVSVEGRPLILVIEAPLSVAFGPKGNPTGRSVEHRGESKRYWYVGLGCCVLVAASYLVRAVSLATRKREVMLVEGLVSFKTARSRSDLRQDVRVLRSVAWSDGEYKGEIVDARKLAVETTDRIESAFVVPGYDLGVPSVIVAEG